MTTNDHMIAMTPTTRAASRTLAAVTAMLVALVAALGWSASARADFGPVPGATSFSTSTTQAGAHPDVTTSFSLNTKQNDSGQTIVDGNVKDVTVDLPAGFVGSAQSVPTCSEAQLATLAVCPAYSQVGIVTVYLNVFGWRLPGRVPLYAVTPANGDTALFGFNVYGQEMVMRVAVRPQDGGLSVTMPNVTETFDVVGSDITMWGVPADPSHDADRYPAGQFSSPGVPAGVPAKPFLTNPTECSGVPLKTTFTFTSWQNPGTPAHDTAESPAVTGCDKVSFDPKISVTPTVSRADSPAGYTVDLSVPQNDNPYGVATANLRKAVVTLPAGVTLNPAVADGLAACSDAQLGIGSAAEPACPNASKLGEVALTTPALPDQLTGGIYLRPQKTGDPYRIALVLQGDGVTLKLPGSVHPDPQTGQLTTTFDDAPQQPFSDLRLTFKGGSRAPLTTPPSCGAATTTTALTPWSAPDSGAAAAPTSAFAVDWDGAGGACPAALPFSPGLSAGVTDPAAGVNSPFVFRVTRDDRNQILGAIRNVHLPAGLTAKVTGVPLCAAADAAAGTCPDATRIGDATVGSGAGTHPLYLPGRVYLTQGYKGAPFGLSIVMPAVAGPFDLGTVVVQAAVRVNPDASLTVDADPLPTVLQGLPLRLRDIALNFDRPGFMINPTSCGPASVTAAISSVDGTTAQVADRFQAIGCSGLGFRPRIVASTKAGNSSRKGAALHVAVAGRAGDANLRTVRFTLPKQIAARLSTAQGACPAASFAAGTCPAASKVGTATATTPILPDALRGDAYLVAQDKALPKLMVTLGGDGISIPLTGDVTLARGRTTTTFDHLPDVPISRFDLDLPMGPHSALAATGNLCKASLVAPTRAIGQNGKVLDQHTRLHVDGCGRHAKAARTSARG